jgi:hypothetical protein
MARKYRQSHGTQYSNVSSFRIMQTIQFDNDVGVYGDCNHNFAITTD